MSIQQFPLSSYHCGVRLGKAHPAEKRILPVFSHLSKNPEILSVEHSLLAKRGIFFLRTSQRKNNVKTTFIVICAPSNGETFLLSVIRKGICTNPRTTNPRTTIPNTTIPRTTNPRRDNS
jgi:hypothetical protein